MSGRAEGEDDEFGYFELGRSFYEEFTKLSNDGNFKGFICGCSPVEILVHLINERDETRAAPPPSDDVRSALVDARAKIAKWPMPNLVTQTNERHEAIASRDGLLKQIDAALRSAPVSAPADSGLIDRLLHGSDDHQTSMVLRKEAARILSAPAVWVTRETIAQKLDEVAKAKSGVYLSSVCTFAMADAVLALRSPAPDATVSEPVAWRWRIKASFDPSYVSGWSFGETHPKIPPELECDIEPLYTSPQHVGREAAVSARDAVIEECAKVAFDIAFVARQKIRSTKGRTERLQAVTGEETAQQIYKAIRSFTGDKP